MAKFIHKERDRISVIALEVVDELGRPVADEEGRVALQAPALWDLLGGLEGLQVLERKSAVLVEMAFFVQQWYPETILISERLRQDARELQWNVWRLKGSATTGNLQISFPFYARRAAATYYLMTQRMLRLPEARQFALLPELQQPL